MPALSFLSPAQRALVERGLTPDGLWTDQQFAAIERTRNEARALTPPQPADGSPWTPNGWIQTIAGWSHSLRGPGGFLFPLTDIAPAPSSFDHLDTFDPSIVARPI